MRYLGIDYGTKKIGLAVSDESGRFAFAYGVIPNTGRKKVIEIIKKICGKERVFKIIMGKSVNYKGEPNPVMSEIEPFKKELELATGLLAEYESEVLTTAEAMRPLEGERKRPPVLNKRKSPEKEIKFKRKIDASAAALILKSYLDKNVIK